MVFSSHKSRFDVEDIRDHLKRITELFLSSNLTQQFSKILLITDDQELYPVQMEIIRIISILSAGIKAFSQIDEEKSPDKSRFKAMSEEQLFQKILVQVCNEEILELALRHIRSDCQEVREQVFMMVGLLVRN